ncbi:hypothetical protein [Phenylobacterium sp.]|uniref:hypothetical protein n=1 Tax=Phenylobacterium sp. TaxID=1871053 RepID=UPI0012098181|nr:hypothetical protein [Phenylobacterium sp.]THD63856.1 MAG: hypothetical protein E8A49_04035 [Phenylobacterium sp.]
MLLLGLMIVSTGLAMPVTATLQMRWFRTRLDKGSDSYFEEQRSRRTYVWLNGRGGIALRGLLLAAWGLLPCLVALHHVGR